MHRLFLADAGKAGAELEIEGREAHHALHVLRVKRGEAVTVLDGQGGEYICEVREAGRHSLRAAVKEKRRSERENADTRGTSRIENSITPDSLARRPAA